jgi:hypothetical protein
LKEWQRLLVGERGKQTSRLKKVHRQSAGKIVYEAQRHKDTEELHEETLCTPQRGIEKNVFVSSKMVRLSFEG